MRSMRCVWMVLISCVWRSCHFSRAVRVTVCARAKKRELAQRLGIHRRAIHLMDFNNATETTSSDLIIVIDTALETARDGKGQKK